MEILSWRSRLAGIVACCVAVGLSSGCEDFSDDDSHSPGDTNAAVTVTVPPASHSKTTAGMWTGVAGTNQISFTMVLQEGEPWPDQHMDESVMDYPQSGTVWWADGQVRNVYGTRYSQDSGQPVYIYLATNDASNLRTTTDQWALMWDEDDTMTGNGAKFLKDPPMGDVVGYSVSLTR